MLYKYTGLYSERIYSGEREGGVLPPAKEGLRTQAGRLSFPGSLAIYSSVSQRLFFWAELYVLGVEYSGKYILVHIFVVSWEIVELIADEQWKVEK